jgi:hypothetical protein
MALRQYPVGSWFGCGIFVSLIYLSSNASTNYTNSLLDFDSYNKLASYAYSKEYLANLPPIPYWNFVDSLRCHYDVDIREAFLSSPLESQAEYRNCGRSSTSHSTLRRAPSSWFAKQSVSMHSWALQYWLKGPLTYHQGPTFHQFGIILLQLELVGYLAEDVQSLCEIVPAVEILLGAERAKFESVDLD